MREYRRLSHIEILTRLKSLTQHFSHCTSLLLQYSCIKCLEEFLERGGGEGDVSDGVSDGAPGEQVDDGEPGGVVGGEDGGGFLRARVTGGEVGLAVLDTGALHAGLFADHGEEHEPAERQGKAVAPGDHERHVGERRGGRTAHGDGTRGGLHGEGLVHLAVGLID